MNEQREGRGERFYSWDHRTLSELASDLTAEVIRLQEENERLKADAERYRWMRSHGLHLIDLAAMTCDTSDVGMDYAVDCQIQALTPKDQ